jgi:hypothetical protein
MLETSLKRGRVSYLVHTHTTLLSPSNTCAVRTNGSPDELLFFAAAEPMEGAMTLQQDRILSGQCPLCGKEAAPYRLCWDHRQEARLVRCLKRGEKHAYFDSEKRADGKRYWTVGPKSDDPDTKRKMSKWSVPIVPSETDRRHRPRLRGISVDVEKTLVKVVEHIGRPCTIEEISSAWGKLRDRRSSPLATDLATIVAAQDKRERKMAKRAAQQVGV